jgi:hypothetical protein
MNHVVIDETIILGTIKEHAKEIFHLASAMMIAKNLTDAYDLSDRIEHHVEIVGEQLDRLPPEAVGFVRNDQGHDIKKLRPAEEIEQLIDEGMRQVRDQCIILIANKGEK